MSNPSLDTEVTTSDPIWSNLIPPSPNPQVLGYNQPVNLKEEIILSHISYDISHKHFEVSYPFGLWSHAFKLSKATFLSSPRVLYLQRVQRHGPSHRLGHVHQERRGLALHRCSCKAAQHGGAAGRVFFCNQKWGWWLMVDRRSKRIKKKVRQF